MIWIHVTCLLLLFSMVLCDFDNEKGDFALHRTSMKTILFSRESFGLRWAQQSAGREYRAWPLMRPRRRRENSMVKQVATKGGDKKRKARRKMRRGRKREPLTRQEKRLRRRGEEKRIHDGNGATRRPRQRHRGHHNRRNLEKQYLVRNRTLELLDKREMQTSDRSSFSSVYPSVDALYERRRIMSEKVGQILGDSGAATSRRISDFLVQKPFKKQSEKNAFRSRNAHRQQLDEAAAIMATSREKKVIVAVERRFDEMTARRANKMADGESKKMADGESNKMADGESNKMADGESNKMADGESNKMANGESNKMAEGESNKMVDGESNKMVDGESNKMVDGESNKMADGESNKMADGESNKMADGESNKMADGESNKMADGESNKMAEGQVSKMKYGRLDREQVNKMDEKKMIAATEKRDEKMAGKQLNEDGQRRFAEMDDGVTSKVEEEVRNEMDGERMNRPDGKRSNKIDDKAMVKTRERIKLRDHSVHSDDEDSPFLETLQVTATNLSERSAAENNLGSDESEKELSENFYPNGYHYDYENVFSEPSISPWSNPSSNKQSPRSADDEYVIDKALLSSVYMPINDQIALHESLAALLSRLFESLRNTTSNANEQLIRDFDFDNSLHDDLCQKWLDCKDKLEEAFLGPLALPACPCRYPSSIFYDDKIWDEAGQRHFRWRDVSGEGERLDVYKPGAAYCVRSLLAQGGGSVAAQHCCYDSRRRLLTRGSGAGTPNFVSPEVSTILHEKIDVLPWRLCKGDFSRFNDVRPPNNDNHCKENPGEEEYRRQIETTKHY